MLEAPRGLSHPQTSFIGTVCQGIHHTPFRAAHAPKNLMIAFLRQTTNHHTVKNDHKTIDLETRLQKTEPGEIAIKQTTAKNAIALLASTIQFSNHHAPERKRPTAHRPTASRRGHPENRTRPSRGWRSGNPKAYPYRSPQAPNGTREANDLFHTSTPTPLREPFPACGPHDGRQTGVLKTP